MIETERLRLRVWREADRLPYSMLCTDEEVMRYLGGTRSLETANANVDKFIKAQQDHGHTFWVMERKDDHSFLGFCGLSVVEEDYPIKGEIEIGWRLRRDAWGHGYAKEASYACFDWGFSNIDVEHIYAMTLSDNSRSWGLMDRLRMKRTPEYDFTDDEFPGEKVIVYARARSWD